MSLNLHLLRLFTVVATEKSFSRAAALLRISQPAVSKGVREFEAQVGITLLERGSRNIEPTDAGVALLAHARTIFAEERSAEETLDAFLGARRGTVRIGASTTIATYLLPKIMREFTESHPDVELVLTSANTRTIAERLSEFQLDVALVEGPVDKSRFKIAPWRSDDMVLLVAPTHPLVSVVPSAISAELLSRERFIVRELGSGTRSWALTALQSFGVSAPRMMEVGSTEAIKQGVAAELGVALLSRVAAADQLELRRLHAISVPGLTAKRTFTQLRLPGRRLSPAVQSFEALLKRHRAS